MKSAVLFVALAALAVSTLGARELKQTLDITFDVCTLPVYRACCLNFDFGTVYTDPIKGKQFPENTTCTVTTAVNTTVSIRTQTTPFKTKTDIHEYIAETPQRVNVTTRTSVIWELLKYDPVNKNHVWTRGSGIFCLCSTTPPAAPSPPAVVAAPVAGVTLTSNATAAALAAATAGIGGGGSLLGGPGTAVPPAGTSTLG